MLRRSVNKVCGAHATGTLAAVALTLPVRLALAESKPIAVYVSGPDAASVREVVLRAIGDIPLADDGSFRSELAKAGQKQPLGEKLERPAIERIRVAAAASMARLGFDDRSGFW